MAGAGQKITEKQLATQVKSGASFLITQPEGEAGSEIESVRRARMDAVVAALKDAGINTGLVTQLDLQNLLGETVKSIEPTDGGLLVTNQDNTTYTVALNLGGLAFNGGYVDEEGWFHLTIDGEDIEGFDPFIIPAGGGGGGSAGSKLVFAMLTSSNMTVLESSGTANISFRFTSVDMESEVPTGTGSLSITVNDTLAETRVITQGEHTINVFNYLRQGSNTVVLSITDAYGATARRTVNITRQTFAMTWNLGNTEICESTLQVNITPTGNGSKVITVFVDGVESQNRTVTTTGRPVSFDLLLGVGVHTIEARGVMTSGGVSMNAEPLLSTVMRVGNGPLVAANLALDTVTQMTAVSIPFRVVDPANNPATVLFYVNGSLYDTQSINRTEQTWTYRPTEAGSLTLSIQCGAGSWSKTITVLSLSDDIQEVTRNLVLKVDPADMTSLAGWDYDGTTITLSENFDTHNGGLMLDEDGVQCIRVKKGDRLTVNYNLFGSDHRRTGCEFKVIYKVTNACAMDATAISCMNGGIGLEVKANSFAVTSESTELTYDTCEEIKTEFECCIDPIGNAENALMMLWESGTPTRVKTYPSGDRFAQTSPVGITVGSDDCDVTLYLIRVYSSNLTKQEIQSNFEADGSDADEMLARHNRNDIYGTDGSTIDPDKLAVACPGLRVMTWHAADMSDSKDKKVTGTLTHRYVQGGARHSWTATGVVQKAQGTSSLRYVDAGCNEDHDFKNGFDLADGSHIDAYAMTDDSIPVTYLNYKTNVASQEHTNNILLAEWFNRFQPHIRPAREADSRVRDTVEGHMCAYFFHNTGDAAVQIGPMTVLPDETVLYSLGCINNSKKNHEVFGENATGDQYSIEVRDNITAQQRFKSDDLSGEDWSGDIHFEFRYLDDSVDQEDAVANFQSFLTWIVSCDAEQAPNTALPTPVTVGGSTYPIDNAAYRKAKYKAEAANWMDMDSILYHQVFTLVFSMLDNRAKNTFWAWNNTESRWHLCFGYDMDTAMGIDNQGELRLDYGYLDTDTIGSAYVYNGHDQVVFAMNRECFATELRNMYISLENAGCFNLDAFADWCDQVQSQAPEALWTEDAWRKDIDTYTVLGATLYLTMLNGKKRTQRRRFLHFQRAFMSSYFTDSNASTDSIIMRGYAPSGELVVEPENVMTITPYCNLFVNVNAANNVYKVRAEAGEPVEVSFESLSSALNNTVIAVYNASMIQDMGSIAHLYPGSIDISHATKLRRLEVGSSIEGYENTNMTDISTGNAPSLEYLNLEGCTALSQAMNLSGNIMLKEVYTRNTAVRSVTFAQYGRLETAYLNAVQSITAKDLYLLETFSMESAASLTTLNVERCAAIDTLALIDAAENIARVRLTGIDWQAAVRQYAAIMRAASVYGMDDAGLDTANAVITGELYFASIGQSKYDRVCAALPDVVVTYGELLEEYTVTFVDALGNTLYVDKTEHGGSVADPVATGIISTPTKAPSVSETYTYYRWNADLTNITEDTVAEPVFTAQTRYYTVRYIDRDPTGVSQDVVKQVDTIVHHGSTRYEGNDLSRDGYVWTGWSATADSVVSDMDIIATYITPLLPASPKDMSQYDYAYSDDPNDESAYTFGELFAIIKSGSVRQYLGGGEVNGEVGKRVKFILDTDLINDTEIIFMLHSIGHYELADGSGMSHADFYMVGLLAGNQRMNPTALNGGGWHSSEMRSWLNNTVYRALPPKLRNLISLSITLASAGNQSTTITQSTDKLRLMSHAEVGFDVAASPYKDEIDARAEQKTFLMYTDNTSRIKKTFNGTGTAQTWWLRSADASSATNFRGVSNGGSAASYSATNTYGVCVGFSC